MFDDMKKKPRRGKRGSGGKMPGGKIPMPKSGKGRGGARKPKGMASRVGSAGGGRRKKGGDSSVEDFEKKWGDSPF